MVFPTHAHTHSHTPTACAHVMNSVTWRAARPRLREACACDRSTSRWSRECLDAFRRARVVRAEYICMCADRMTNTEQGREREEWASGVNSYSAYRTTENIYLNRPAPRLAADGAAMRAHSCYSVRLNGCAFACARVCLCTGLRDVQYYNLRAAPNRINVMCARRPPCERLRVLRISRSHANGIYAGSGGKGGRHVCTHKRKHARTYARKHAHTYT